MSHRSRAPRQIQDDLVDQTLDALAESSEGHRQRLFEARESLAELTAIVSSGPRPGLDKLCETIYEFLSLMLKQGAVEEPDGLGIAMRLVDYVGVALSCPVPMNTYGGPALSLSAGGAKRSIPPAVRRTKVRPEDLSFDSIDQTRLGEILVKMGTIEADDLDRALVLQRVVHQRLGEVLVSVGALSDETLNEALKVQREKTIAITEGQQPAQDDDGPRRAG